MTDATPIPAAARLADWDLFLVVWYPHSGGRWLNRGLLQRHPGLAMSEFFSPFLHHSTDQLLRLDQTEQVHKSRSMPALEGEFQAVFRSVDTARRAGIAAYFAEKRELMLRSAPSKRHGGVLPVGAQIAVPDLGLLTELLPRLKFVHLIRHPVDCFRSLATRRELDGNPYRIGATWSALNASVRAMGVRAPGRYRCLRYEDLVSNPEAELEALLEWLGLDFDPVVRNGYAEYHGRNHGRDLSELADAAEVDALMSVAGGEATFYGYRPLIDASASAQSHTPMVVQPQPTPLTSIDRIYLNQALFDHHSVDLPPAEILTREVVNMPAALRPNLVAFVDGLRNGKVGAIGDAISGLAQAGAPVAAGRHQAFVSAVNECGAPAGAVVFVAEIPYFQILREALHLRTRGFACYLLCRQPVPAGLTAGFSRAFDQVLALPTKSTMAEFVALVGTLRPRLFHIQLWMWKYHLGRLLLDASQGVPVVCEFYDITSVYADRKAMARHWGPTVVDLDLACEAEIWRRADGIVSRFPVELTEVLRAYLGGRGDVIEFQPWPTPEFLCYDVPKLSAQSGRLHLVFAGGIIPPNDQHPPELFPSWQMHLAMRSMLRQGFAIHVLHDPHRDIGDAPEFANYRALQAEFSTFRLLPGTSPDQLAGRLAAYDFGLVLSYMDKEISALSPQQFDLAIGTKLFSYFEAGLPVIVNAEFGRQAALVEENGLGLAVRSADIDGLMPRVAPFDRLAAGRNVRDFNRRNSMSERIGDLVKLYDRISTREQKAAS